MLLLASCASYEPSSVPVSPAPTTASAAVEGSAVTVIGQLYRNPSGKEAVFDADLDDDGIFAIQMDVHNRTSQKLAVKRSETTLRLANGREISTISGASAALRVDEEGSVFGAALAFGIIGAIVAASAEDEAKQARVEDYSRKEFRDTVLAPGNRAGGFVFFAPADGTPPFSEATLVVRMSDPVSGAVEAVAVPITGFTGASESVAASVSVAPPSSSSVALVPAASPAVGAYSMVGQYNLPSDAYIHGPTGLLFPRATADFWRTRVSEFDVGGQPMLIADYEGATPSGAALATMRVLRPKAQNAGALPSQFCDEQMRSVSNAIITAREGRLIDERDVTLVRGSISIPGSMMAFEYVFAGRPVEDRFYLFCDIGGGWVLSQRVSFPRGELLAQTLEAFLDQAPAFSGMPGVPTMPAAATLRPAGSQVYSGTPQTGTPMTGTPLFELSPAVVDTESTPGASDLYCRKAFSASGSCGSDPNAR